MSQRHLLTLLGAILIAIGLVERGWLLLALWLGGDFLVLAIAHGVGAHRIFGKRADGSLPLWSWLAFLPFLLYITAVWHAIRLLSRERAYHAVTESLVVGRRLLPAEVPGQFDNYVDLTAELAEPPAIGRFAAYQCFPILDRSAPEPEALHDAVSRLRPGKTFIHCAQGYGRTGLFALAVLLKSGVARTVSDGLRMLTGVRPGIGLSRAQRRCIEAFAERFVT
jgi:hypothetical protein